MTANLILMNLQAPPSQYVCIYKATFLYYSLIYKDIKRYISSSHIKSIAKRLTQLRK